MLGRFLEISIHTPDLLDSIGFFEALGLSQAVAGDIWSHGYGVVTDGHVALGLHAYAFASPALVWVHPRVAKFGRQLEADGINLEFLKTGEEQFNELGFLDPDGQMITLVEARTFSPPSTPPPPPAAGYFSEYRYPVRRLDDAIVFWEGMGFVATDHSGPPSPRAALTSDGVDLCLYESARREPPCLLFTTPDMDATEALLTQRGLEPVSAEDQVLGVPSLALQAPEGTAICIVRETL
ncbi:MAG: hypothetical protein WBN65_10210 [Gammaproteobacteria bacterium]